MFKSKIAVLASTLIISGVASADLNTKLVAHWGFDDCTANDVSGNLHHGIVNGTPQCVDSVLGKGLRFDGSSFIDLGDMAYLPKQAITFSLWVKKEQVGSGRFDGFIGKWHSAGGGRHNSFLFYNGEQSWADYPTFVLSFNSTELSVKGKTKTPLNKFMHIAATWSSVTGKLKIYQDGKLSRTLDNAGKGQSIVNDVYEYTAKIGNWGYPHPPSTYNFIGTLDDIRLYSRALSDSEIKRLYDSAIPVSGLVRSFGKFTVTCSNETTGNSVALPIQSKNDWNCEKSGLTVTPNDHVIIKIDGNVQ